MSFEWLGPSIAVEFATNQTGEPCTLYSRTLHLVRPYAVTTGTAETAELLANSVAKN